MPHSTNHIPHTYRIAITGPECTGKSELARELAHHYKSVWVPEYSRQYLSDIGRKYNYEDVLTISKSQWENELTLLSEAGNLLFSDTEFIVNKIWCDDKFGKCHPWILEMITMHPYDLYLLCDTDLPWIFDPLRENPHDRERLFELFRQELQSRGLKYETISGTGSERLKNAIRIVDKFTDNCPESTVN
jgi:NadR type nicotinamide-nucleotide adenylyltransferase